MPISPRSSRRSTTCSYANSRVHLAKLAWSAAVSASAQTERDVQAGRWSSSEYLQTFLRPKKPDSVLHMSIALMPADTAKSMLSDLLPVAEELSQGQEAFSVLRFTIERDSRARVHSHYHERLVRILTKYGMPPSFSMMELADWLGEMMKAHHEDKELGARGMQFFHYFCQAWLASDYQGIRVWYRHSLEGLGTHTAPIMVGYFEKYLADRKRSRVLEAFAGPGFIGFGLLGAGFAGELHLADINPAVKECIDRTCAEANLGNRVFVHIGDGFSALPPNASFDSIVGNPPACYSHFDSSGFFATGNDLISNDPDWSLARTFYRGVAARLNPGGAVIMTAYGPHSLEIEGVDKRPRKPVDEFMQMIAEGNLDLVRLEQPPVGDLFLGEHLWFFHSTAKPQHRV
jgi:hypothetical protein